MPSIRAARILLPRVITSVCLIVALLDAVQVVTAERQRIQHG